MKISYSEYRSFVIGCDKNAAIGAIKILLDNNCNIISKRKYLFSGTTIDGPFYCSIKTFLRNGYPRVLINVSEQTQKTKIEISLTRSAISDMFSYALLFITWIAFVWIFKLDLLYSAVAAFVAIGYISVFQAIEINRKFPEILNSFENQLNEIIGKKQFDS